jgi:hypothetical protein
MPRSPGSPKSHGIAGIENQNPFSPQITAEKRKITSKSNKARAEFDKD